MVLTILRGMGLLKRPFIVDDLNVIWSEYNLQIALNQLKCSSSLHA